MPRYTFVYRFDGVSVSPILLLCLTLSSVACKALEDYQEEKEILCLCKPNDTLSTVGPWIENKVVAGLRVWQLGSLILIGLLFLVIGLCCVMKCRVPRTKDEIEEKYRRNKLVKRFRKQIRGIKMDEDTDLFSVLQYVVQNFHVKSSPVSSLFTEEMETMISYNSDSYKQFCSYQDEKPSTNDLTAIQKLPDIQEENTAENSSVRTLIDDAKNNDVSN